MTVSSNLDDFSDGPKSSNGKVSRIEQGNDLAILSLYRMPKGMRTDFYPDLVGKILPFCGNEYQTSDYHSAVRVLNNELNLQLPATEERVLSLLLTGLAQAHRFQGNVYVAPRLGENSAVHSCHTAILLNDLFRRAGLLSGEQQTNEVSSMRLEMTLACLIHDMGEILGEFNTLLQRVVDSDLTEDPFIERKVFETALRLAYKAVHEDRVDMFYHMLQELRDFTEEARRTCDSQSHLHGVLSLELAKVSLHHSLGEIPEQHQGGTEMFLQLFDMPELKSESGLSRAKIFRGYAVKAAEHVQGTRHFIRMSKKGDDYEPLRLFSPKSSISEKSHEEVIGYDEALTIPYSLAPSALLRKGAIYNEAEVGHLFRYAESEVELLLATAVRDAVYLTQAESLNSASPYFDRKETKLDKSVGDMIKEIGDPTKMFEIRLATARKLVNELNEKQSALSSELGKLREKNEKIETLERTQLLPIETRSRLVSLYVKAVEADYIPGPGEILIDHDILPEALTPLAERNFVDMSSGGNR